MRGDWLNTTEGKVHRSHYNSLVDACSAVADPKNSATQERSQRELRGEHWYGPDTGGEREGALRLYREGWASGAKRISEMRAAVNVPPVSVRRRRVWADQGDELDIHRVNSGRLDVAWQATRRQARVATRSVTIISPITILARETVEELYPRSAAALKLADVLTNAGYSVGIVATVPARNTNGGGSVFHCVHSISVKEPDQMLDLSNLAATMAHPGFFRTIGFAMIASADRVTCSSYGTGDYGNKLTEIVAKEYRDAGDHVITMGHGIKDERSATQWLDQQIEAFNTAM